MSYLKKIDKKKTIRRAKEELQDFHDLYVLTRPESRYGISAVNFNDFISITSFINKDQIMIQEIMKSDSREKEVYSILETIQEMDIGLRQILYLKYVLGKSPDFICEKLCIAERTYYRALNEALYTFALKRNLEIYKE